MPVGTYQALTAVSKVAGPSVFLSSNRERLQVEFRGHNMRRFSVFRHVICASLLAALAAFLVSAQTANAQPAPPYSESPQILWTLHAVLERASKDSPAILAARADVDVTRAKVRQARSHWFGSVDLYAVRSRYNEPMLTQPITSFPPPPSFS